MEATWPGHSSLRLAGCGNPSHRITNLRGGHTTRWTMSGRQAQPTGLEHFQEGSLAMELTETLRQSFSCSPLGQHGSHGMEQNQSESTELSSALGQSGLCLSEERPVGFSGVFPRPCKFIPRTSKVMLKFTRLHFPSPCTVCRWEENDTSHRILL